MVERPDHVSIPLSNLSGGVNRFVQEAGPNQCADALDAINDQGEVRRRDAFIPIGSGAPHITPANFCRLATADVNNANIADVADRNPNMNAIGYVYVGARFTGTAPYGQFDGIDWRVVAGSGTATQQLVIVPQYWRSVAGETAAWTAVPGYMDETRDVVSDYLIPLVRDGYIYWHTSQFSTSWATTNSPGGAATYWIRLAIQTLAGAAATLPNGYSLIAPGARLFHHAPVRAIFPGKIENRSALVLATDRSARTWLNGSLLPGEQSSLAGGLEKGAQIGIKLEESGSVVPALLLEDEGAGVYGVMAWPQPTRNGTGIGSSGLTYGTASRLQKIKTVLFNPENNVYEPYVWWDDQFRGGRLTNALTPAAAFDTATVRTTTALPNTQDGFYRGCRIRVSTKGAGGTPLDEEREIWDYDNAATSVFSVYPAWSTAPDGDNRFIVYAPHARLQIDEFINRTFDIRGNQEHTLQLTDALAHEPSGSLLGTVQFFHVGRELRWTVDAAAAWSAVIDKVTGRMLLTNGHSGLLEYDGSHIRKMKADFRSDVALGEVGQLPDRNPANLENRNLALSLLRHTPPDGKYITQHRGRIFVAGLASDPLRVMWSSYGGANNIWPLINEGMVRDEEQDPISGMATLDDRLIVFTPTALHEAVPIDQAPFFDFAPLSRGIGFVGHNAVCVIAGNTQSSMLAGVAPDGIYSYASGEPSIILDDWNRLLDGGVNQDALFGAVAVAAPQKSWALFAVPARGSDTNNRILVWDFFRNLWWVWSAPFGIASMAVDYDEAGKERILFGTNDGYVMTLGDATTDDGTTINAFAMSAPIQPFGGTEGSLSGILLTARTLGPGTAQRMNCDILTGDDSDVPLQVGVLTIDKGDMAWNSGLWSAASLPVTSPNFLWQKHGFKTVRMGIVSYAKAHRVAYRVGGTVAWSVRQAELVVRSLSRRGR